MTDQGSARRPALARAGVDRAAHRRDDEAWLRAAYDDPRTRLLVLDDGRVPVREQEGGPTLALVGPEELPPFGLRILLGEDADGVAYFAATGPLPRVPGSRPLGLREVGALLSDQDVGLLVEAVALTNWHAGHTHCARCGARTEVTKAGHQRRCPEDGSDHFPRTDPAVIMLVHDGADHCVLGRQPVWPPGRFSTLAGFVEPGESAEMAVVREVLEEVGLHVTDTSYAGSQPWPFPSSLMLGFTARALDREITVDAEEIAEARWFSRDELRSAVARGEVRVPPPVSIAWRLITDWVGGEPLAGAW